MKEKIIQISKDLEKGSSLCGGDFENELKATYVNLRQVSSVSGREKLTLPLSGNFVGYYSIVSMGNGDNFYIGEKEGIELISIIAPTEHSSNI